MRPALLARFAILLLGIATGAFADDITPATHYRWHDAQGGLHYSDSIPPDAVRFGYDILNSDGLLVRHIEREQTPQERAAAAAVAARAAAAKRAADQQALVDTQLLAAYPTEAELNEAHQAKLAQMKQEIGTTQSNLRSQEQSLADLLAHAAELERGGNPVPAFMRTRLATQRKTVADERGSVTRMQRDRAATARQLDAELQRYRMLRAKVGSEGSSGNGSG